MNPKSLRGVLACLAVAACFAASFCTRGAAQKPPTRAEFMRLKLEYSKLILEGLALEDYDRISKNAHALKLLSQGAEWEVPTIPNADDYLTYTTEFQKLCDVLRQNAKDKNLDGATLTYMRLTMNCVNCHKYVRFPKK